MSPKIQKILSIVLLILDIAFLFALIISEVMSYDITSTTIDSSFLESTKELYILSTIRRNSLVALIVTTIAFLGVLFQKAYIGKSESKLILIIGMAFIIVPVMIVKTTIELIPAVSNEPVLRKSVITETDSDYSRRGGWSYYLIIEDQKISVTELEYKSAKKGDPYYIICCGDKIIETCNPKKYTDAEKPEFLTEMGW